MNSHKKDYLLFILLIIAINGLYLYDPFISVFNSLGNSVRSILSICLFHNLTEIPCPLCGLSRSLYLNLHGQFSAAFSIHPLGILILLILIAYTILCAANFITVKSHIPDISFNKFLSALSLIFISVWLIRLFFFNLRSLPL